MRTLSLSSKRKLALDFAPLLFLMVQVPALRLGAISLR